MAFKKTTPIDLVAIDNAVSDLQSWRITKPRFGIIEDIENSLEKVEDMIEEREGT